MKMNRFLSLVLAMVMSLALAAPALADEPDDPDEGIMPPSQVYAEEPVSTSSGNSVGPFTTTPANGKYLQVWFLNQGAAPVNVMLLDHATGKVLASRSVPVGGGGEVLIYEIPTPNKPCTYRIRFECPPNGDWITGRVAAAQYRTDPDEGIMPPAQQLIVDKLIKDDGGYNSRAFTTTPSNGKYIRVWFRNYASEDAVVMLIPEGSTTPVASDTAKPQGKDAEVIFEIPTPDKPCSYYVCIEATGTGGRIYGRLSAAQHPTKPSN